MGKVVCRVCSGVGKAYPEHLRGGMVALDTIPGYDPRVKCPGCDGIGLRDKDIPAAGFGMEEF